MNTIETNEDIQQEESFEALPTETDIPKEHDESLDLSTLLDNEGLLEEYDLWLEELKDARKGWSCREHDVERER